MQQCSVFAVIKYVSHGKAALAVFMSCIVSNVSELYLCGLN